MALDETLARQQRLHEHVVKALAHIPRDRAISMVLSWFSLDELEYEIIPTLAPGFSKQT